jgi:hypothetical protein
MRFVVTLARSKQAVCLALCWKAIIACFVQNHISFRGFRASISGWLGKEVKQWQNVHTVARRPLSEEIDPGLIKQLNEHSDRICKK